MLFNIARYEIALKHSIEFLSETEEFLADLDFELELKSARENGTEAVRKFASEIAKYKNGTKQRVADCNCRIVDFERALQHNHSTKFAAMRDEFRRLNARFSELQPKFEVMFDKAMDQLYRSMVADAKTREEIEKGIASCQRYISLFEQAGRPIVDPGNEFIATLKYYREALELLDSTEGSES